MAIKKNKLTSKCINALLCSIILLSCTTAGATDTKYQEASGSGGSGGGLYYGLRTGININQFNFSNPSLGLNAGGFVIYRINDFLSFQGELLYNIQGGGRENYSRDYSIIGGNISQIDFTNRSVIMHNISTPIMVGLNIPGMVSENVTPRLLLGGSYSFNLAAFEYHDKIYYFDDGSEGIVGYKNENVRSDFQVHQFSLIGAISFDFNLSESKLLSVELRYSQGINDINLFKSSYTGGPLYQNTVCINFGISF